MIWPSSGPTPDARRRAAAPTPADTDAYGRSVTRGRRASPVPARRAAATPPPTARARPAANSAPLDQPQRVDRVARAIVPAEPHVPVHQVGDELHHRATISRCSARRELSAGARARIVAAASSSTRSPTGYARDNSQRLGVARRRDRARTEHEVPRQHGPAQQDRRDVEPELRPLAPLARCGREGEKRPPPTADTRAARRHRPTRPFARCRSRPRSKIWHASLAKMHIDAPASRIQARRVPAPSAG